MNGGEEWQMQIEFQQQVLQNLQAQNQFLQQQVLAAQQAQGVLDLNVELSDTDDEVDVNMDEVIEEQPAEGVMVVEDISDDDSIWTDNSEEPDENIDLNEMVTDD